jgi:hypothetical protein
MTKKAVLSLSWISKFAILSSRFVLQIKNAKKPVMKTVFVASVTIVALIVENLSIQIYKKKLLFE